jgi:uncharacterized membrane protein
MASALLDSSASNHPADMKEDAPMRPAKVLGHHIHPMLIVFPLGLLGFAVLCDILYVALDDHGFAVISFFDMAAGIIGGLVAAVFGLWDWTTIPSKTRAKAIGATHGIMNVVVVGLFAASWLIRRNDPGLVPDGTALALSFLGFGLVLISGWLGGELVERLGIGVDPNAGVNAPSSLRSPPGSHPGSTGTLERPVTRR